MNRRPLALFVLFAILTLAAGGAYLATTGLTISGVITDSLTGQPLEGVEMKAGSATARSDVQGRYTLRAPAGSASAAATRAGYQPVEGALRRESWLGRTMTLDIALPPTIVEGVVTDAVSGQPLADVTLAAGGLTLTTPADGRYRFERLSQGEAILVRADGYEEQRLVFDDRLSPDISLAPNTVTASVVDQSDGSMIAQAWLRLAAQDAPGSQGQFVLRGLKQQAELSVFADGYLPATMRYSGGSAITITLAANTVGGLVRDQSTGQALAGVTVTLQQINNTRTTVSSPAGDFSFQRVHKGALLTASGPDHAPAAITYTGQASLTFSLRPDVLRGAVRNLYTGQPLAGAAVALQHGSETRATPTDESGRFRFPHAELGAVVSAALPGHAPAVLTYTGQISVELALRPNTLHGVVRDGRNGQPVAGATVGVGDVITRTAADGTYALAGIPAGFPLVVSANGYDKAHVSIDSTVTLNVTMHAQSFAVRGIFIPFYLLTVPDRVRSLITFADRAGMNAIVVDIKGDDGYIAYKSEIPLAKEIKAQWPGDMMSLDEVLKLAKQRGMYTIARMVVFKDNLLAEARPDLAVRDKSTGKIWDDCGNGSTYWADPFRKEVVDYNAGIAEEAARMGFDEIQFDYIRFPPACISRIRLANASYAMTSTMETRIAAIETFLAEARRRVRPLGVAIAVDTFGWTLLRDDDLAIGQRMENIAKYVDYICPMVYPSTWEPGALGLDYVPAHPYEVVYKGITFALNRLKATPSVKIRPWLQDFDDYQDRELPYGVTELDAQRKEAADALAKGLIQWNAGRL